MCVTSKRKGPGKEGGGSFPWRRGETLNRRGKYLTFVLGPEVVYGWHSNRLQCRAREGGRGKGPRFHLPPSPASLVPTEPTGCNRSSRGPGGGSRERGCGVMKRHHRQFMANADLREPIPGERGRDASSQKQKLRERQQRGKEGDLKVFIE